MERYKSPRFITALLGLGLGAAVLTGCGQDSPPSPEDIRDDKPVIEDTYDEKFSNNDRNNWIVKEVYRNNILKESTERNITYF